MLNFLLSTFLLLLNYFCLINFAFFLYEICSITMTCMYFYFVKFDIINILINQRKYYFVLVIVQKPVLF